MFKIKEGLVFNEQSHSYYYEGKKCKGVTTLLNKYYKPFDKDYWSGIVSLRDGKTQMEVLKEWSEKAEKSMEFGKKIHLYAENYVLKKQLPQILTEKEANYTSQIVRFFEKTELKPVDVECKICSTEHLIAGTVDLVMKNRSDDIFIMDWKTNEKINVVNDYGQMLLPPFEDLQDCELTKYSLQLGCYKKILELDGINVKKLFLIWLKEDGYEMIECDNLDKEVKIIFEGEKNGRKEKI